MVSKTLYSSKQTDIGTPAEVFKYLDLVYGPFSLDVCATRDNAKCLRFFSEKQDGLAQDWGKECCWMNPPYGREIRKWMRKAREAAERGATVCCLVPARTDTKWFQEEVLGYASELEFWKGRIKFDGMKAGAPFPSVVIVYRPPGGWVDRPAFKTEINIPRSAA